MRYFLSKECSLTIYHSGLYRLMNGGSNLLRQLWTGSLLMVKMSEHGWIMWSSFKWHSMTSNSY